MFFVIRLSCLAWAERHGSTHNKPNTDFAEESDETAVQNSGATAAKTTPVAIGKDYRSVNSHNWIFVCVYL